MEKFNFNNRERYDLEIYCTVHQVANISVYVDKDADIYDISKAYLAATPNATEIKIYKKGAFIMAHSNK